MRKIMFMISTLFLFFLLFLIATGCQTAQAPTPTPILTTITVSPESVSLANGQTCQFYATCKDQDGNDMEGQAVSWSVAGGIGTISNAGLLTSSYSGRTERTLASGTVKATADGITGESTVTIDTASRVLTIDCQQNTYVDELLPNTLYYSSTTHYVGYWTIYGGFFDTGLIQFDVSSIPSYATITSANLNLYIQEVPGVDTTIYFYNVASSWDETTTTWNTRPSSTGLTSVASKAFSTTDSGWISIDISDCVQQWVDGTITNNGLIYGSMDSLQWNVIKYYSKASSVNKPKLEIVADY